MSRDEAIKRIRTGLQRRTGRAWSVTGGRGTAWGWIRIDAPPRRRTVHYRLKLGAITNHPQDYEEVDTGEPGGHMTIKDRLELGFQLGLGNDPVDHQGVSIPASNDYWEEYVDRAEGRTPRVLGKEYWD